MNSFYTSQLFFLKGALNSQTACRNKTKKDNAFYKGDGINMYTTLQTILLETKDCYQKASNSIEHYQLRHVLAQLIEERVYLIRSIDIALTLNPKELSFLNESELHKPILGIINRTQKEILLNNQAAIVFNSIVQCETETLTLVKSLLMEAQQQTSRNLLSSLAASLQIRLDKLEQLEF